MDVVRSFVAGNVALLLLSLPSSLHRRMGFDGWAGDGDGDGGDVAGWGGGGVEGGDSN